VALVRTDVSEEGIAFIVPANVVPSLLILSTLMMEAIRSSETSVLTRHCVTSQGTAFFEIIWVLTKKEIEAHAWLPKPRPKIRHAY
jgi:hypothetical protein